MSVDLLAERRMSFLMTFVAQRYTAHVVCVMICIYFISNLDLHIMSSVNRALPRVFFCEHSHDVSEALFIMMDTKIVLFAT